MSTQIKALLLVGSPKSSSSASFSLGNSLLLKLAEKGLLIDKEFIYKLVRKDEGQKKLLSKVDNSDLIILSFPLYVDCLPAGVIKALELIRDHRDVLQDSKRQAFAVIVNCGFPETQHNFIASEICKIFAREVGFEWKGALTLGMGGFIARRALEDVGGMAKNLILGFDIAATALAKGDTIPEEAKELVGKKFMSYTLYTKMGNLSWKLQAKKFGARKKIKDRPYL
ncbi:MAG: hypothetical protein ACTSV5_04910 [Promethearchaeota archaeon]